MFDNTLDINQGYAHIYTDWAELRMENPNTLNSSPLALGRIHFDPKRQTLPLG